MSYFKQVQYSEGSKGAMYISLKWGPIDSGDVSTIIQIFKDDDYGKRVCAQSLNLDDIDNVIEELQKCKQRMIDYSHGQTVSFSKSDIQADNQYQQLKNNFFKKKWWQF